MSGRSWLGVHIKSDGAITAADAVALVREAERLGYAGATLNEDVGHDVFGLLGAMSGVTKRILIGTAIVNVYTRSALQIAMGAATIDDLSAGRAMLGVSVGHHPWNDRYHGIALEPPLARLREYVGFLKLALTGEPFRFEGEIFHDVEAQLGFPLYRRDLPVYIGGDRPNMLALSAEVADGSIMNVVPARYVAEFAAPHYFDTARRAGRDVSALELCAIVTCCVSDDREAALRDAREAFVGRLRTNPAKVIALRPRDHRDELARIDALITGNQLERAIAEIPDEIVTDTIAAGNAEDVAKALGSFRAAGCTRVLVSAYPRTYAKVQATLDALAPLNAP